MQTEKERRVHVSLLCKDAEAIQKVPDAGGIWRDDEGRDIQTMHNGVKVLAGSYYSELYSDIIKGLRGHHEPQEELVFDAILKEIKPGGCMIELGAYWSYYSLWFQKAVTNARNIMVEPVPQNLEVGKANFALNACQGTFINALVGSSANPATSPATVSVGQIMADHQIDDLAILHSDIQGHELEMLEGAKAALHQRRIDFLVISTHGELMHRKILRHLQQANYSCIAEHSPAESYSWDGLVAATRRKDFPTIKVSRRKSFSLDYIKSLATKMVFLFR